LIVYSFLTHGAFATCQSFCNAYMDEGLGLSPAAIGLIAGGGDSSAALASFNNTATSVGSCL
jgi:hypothetical protein